MLMICFRHICISLFWIVRVAALFVITAAIAILVGGFVAVKVLTPENLTAIVTLKANEIFQMPVSIKNVRVVFFQGIKIESVKIFDNSNRLGKDLFSSGNISLDYELFPMLRKQLVLDEITLNNPKITLIKNTDGTWNFENIIPGKSVSDGKKSSFDVRFNVKQANIKNAMVTIIDAKKDRTDVFYNVNLSIWHAKNEGNFPYKIDFISKNEIGGKTASMEVLAEGLVNLAGFDFKKSSITNTRSKINFLTKPIILNFNMSDFTNPKFFLSADVPEIVYKDLSLFIKKPVALNLPPSKWTVRGFLYDTLVLKSITGYIENVKLKASGKVEFLKGETNYSFKANTDSFDMSSVSGYWSELLKYALKGKTKVSADISGNRKRISFDRMHINVEKAKGVARDFICSDVSFNADFVNGLKNINLEVLNADVKVHNQTFKNLKVKGIYSNDTIEVKNFRGKYNNSDFKTKITVTNLTDKVKRKVSAIMRFEHLKLPLFFDTVSDISKAISGKPPKSKKWSGELSWLRNFRDRLPKFMPNFKGAVLAERFTTPVISGSDLKLDYDLRGLKPNMEKLNGRIDASIGPGVIHQLEYMASKQKALDVAFKPFIAMYNLERSGSFKSGTLKDTGYRRVAGSFDFANGTSHIYNFFVDGIRLSAAGEGEVDWVGEKLDITMKTLFETAGAGGLSENLTDETGKPALSFKVTGSMMKPNVEIKSPKGVSRHIEESLKKSIRSKFEKLKELRN